MPSLSSLSRVQMCMRVEFHQRKNGLSAFFASVMKRSASLVTSSSIVSIRFLFSGPVLSIFCVPSGLAQVWITPRVPNLFRSSGSLK